MESGQQWRRKRTAGDRVPDDLYARPLHRRRLCDPREAGVGAHMPAEPNAALICTQTLRGPWALFAKGGDRGWKLPQALYNFRNCKHGEVDRGRDAQ